jgi:hypothetical protein
MDPVRNPLCDCSINYHPFGSFSLGSNPDRDYECHAVYDKGRCGFTLRVQAGQWGSNRVNTDIDTELNSFAKIFEHDQNFFFAVS